MESINGWDFLEKGPRKRKKSRAVSLEASIFKSKVDEEEEENLKNSNSSSARRLLTILARTRSVL